MSHTAAYSGKQDPINCPANQPKPATEELPIDWFTVEGEQVVRFEDYQKLQQQLAAERKLREGDNKLIRALAEDAGIKITASDKSLGAQWEQFHDGVTQLAAEREFIEQLARRYGRANRQMLYDVETFLGKKLPRPHQ